MRNEGDAVVVEVETAWPVGICRPILRREEPIGGLPADLLGGPAENPLGSAVPVDNQAPGIETDDGEIDRALEDRAIARVRHHVSNYPSSPAHRTASSNIYMANDGMATRLVWQCDTASAKSSFMIGETYLEELDTLLLDMPEEGMLLSELDSFLTGIIVSPDPVPQSRWLKLVWGDGPPAFEDTAALQAFLARLMQHHNQIISDLTSAGEYEPVLEIDTRNDDTLWEIWIEGFFKAMKMASGGWNRILASDDEAAKAAVAGLTLLADFYTGRVELDKEAEDRWNRQAPDLSRSGFNRCTRGGLRRTASRTPRRSGATTRARAAPTRSIRNAAG